MLSLAGARPEEEADVRTQIREHVEAYPGLHLSEIARHLEIPTNHAKYHLRRLEKQDLVSSLKDDGYWRFFPRTNGSVGVREVVDRRDKELLALLRRPKPLHIALHLLHAEEDTHSQIAEAVEIAGATAHYHLKKLVKAGVLKQRKEGRCVYYSLTEPRKVQRLIAAYEPPDPLVDGFLEAWEGLEIG